jgi:hypothetical protein
MAVDDVANGLVRLHDAEIRSRVAAGHLAALGVGDLTDEEAQLLRDAASEEPEVETFDIMGSSYYPSLQYIADNRLQLSSSVRTDFNTFFRSRYGNSWTIALMG